MVAKTILRGWQIDQLRKGLKIVDSALSEVPAEALHTYRDGGTGWTAIEVLCHLRDYEAIFLERAKITTETEDGQMPNPNPDELAQERKYNEQALADVYGEWSARRTTFLAYLESLDESAWEKTATHPRRGVMSLHDQLTLTCWHDANHIEQMTRILAERK